jgi:pyruvate-formate lyase
VGCLENTMVGNDRSGTVDNNLNLLKAVELALNGGKDLVPFTDPMTGKTEKIRQDGPATGEPPPLRFEEFWQGLCRQTATLLKNA